jgi:trimethylamine:corrinoid methyltransferase-like protein
LGKRANDRARHLLENHKPRPLEDKIRAELRKIVNSKDR